MASEALTQFANKISGQTTKACMYFIKTSYGAEASSKPKVTIKPNGTVNALAADYMFSPSYMKSASGKVLDGSALEAYKTEYINKSLKDKLNGLNVDIIGDDQQGQADDLNNNLDENANDEMKVCLQFNPTSIHIDASGGGLEPVYNSVAPAKDGEKNKDNGGAIGVKYRRGKEHIDITISTVFDALNITDAFMGDNFNIENKVKGLGKSISSKISGSSDQYSIRPIMEGFLAAFSETYRQEVRFQWGDLKYTGIMTRINCKYTMFNRAGEPVRATVSFTILSSHGGKDKPWEDRYKDLVNNCIDSEGNVKTSTNTSSRIANNLINLQL